MISFPPSVTRSEKQVFIAGACFLCAAAVMQVCAGFAGDKGWLLLAAREWLEGRVLYRDVVEVNPPLVLWLYAIPVWLSLHGAFFSDYAVMAVLGLLASVVCAVMGGMVIRLHPAFAQKSRQAGFALFLALLFIFFTSPVYFFDRDHIFWVLTFPYLLRFMPSVAREKIPLLLQVGISLAAAIGFCIKPHTAIVFLALQLLYIKRERTLAMLWSFENALIYAVAAIYLACIMAFTPEYIHVIMPMALATYSAFSRRILGLFYCILAFIIAGVAFADFRQRHDSPYRRDIFYFIGAALAYLAYALAGNGWGYTYHPLLGTLLFLTGWIYLEYDWLEGKHRGTEKQEIRTFVFGKRACVLSLLCNTAYMLYGLIIFFATPACEWSADCMKNRPYVDYIREHHIKSFGAFSEDFHKWPSLVRLSGATFETRYNALWMVPELALEQQHPHPDSAQKQWIVENVGRGLADDLMRKQPDIVFVDNSPKFFGYDFALDLPGFFSGIPEFKQAWGQYRYADTIDGCRAQRRSAPPLSSGCRYDIYRRGP